MNKKYELVPEDCLNGLTRIRALRDIPEIGVKAGDLGGYIGTEKNLSQAGNCWVSGDARVYGDAMIKSSADYCVFSRVGSENGSLTVCKGKEGLLAVRGCFNGTLDQFAETVKRNSTEKIKNEYALLIQFARLRLEGRYELASKKPS